MSEFGFDIFTPSGHSLVSSGATMYAAAPLVNATAVNVMPPTSTQINSVLGEAGFEYYNWHTHTASVAGQESAPPILAAVLPAYPAAVGIEAMVWDAGSACWIVYLTATPGHTPQVCAFPSFAQLGRSADEWGIWAKNADGSLAFDSGYAPLCSPAAPAYLAVATDLPTTESFSVAGIEAGTVLVVSPWLVRRAAHDTGYVA